MSVDVISILAVSYIRFGLIINTLKIELQMESFPLNIKKNHDARGQRSFQITQYGDA